MSKNIATNILEYNKLQTADVRKICDFLELNISKSFKKSESKIWHGSPVWFIEGKTDIIYQ